MMELLTSPEAWIAFLTLAVLEIVLGIDNLVFISIISAKLPAADRPKARKLGLALAVITRVIFLLSLSWLMSLSKPLFSLPIPGLEDPDISGRDLILLLGGLFLMGKATVEIHNKLEGEEHTVEGEARKGGTMLAVIAQILAVDLVFSIDSVITAVGMVDNVAIMIAAVIVAVIIMLVFVNPISDFVDKHPTVKMLALAFLVLIGVNLVADGLGQHIPKGYTYFAMGFSVFVEMLNLKLRKPAPEPVHLRNNVPLPEEPSISHGELI